MPGSRTPSPQPLSPRGRGAFGSFSPGGRRRPEGPDEGAPVPGLIVAAPSSGSGKTVVTLALLRALRNRGVAVGALKVGPDYIDPAFQAAAAGRPCYNVDPWAMRAETLQAVRTRAAAGAETVIAEGVMGLFDGAADGSGSTADLAAMTGWPVLLVIDVRGQGATVSAVVRGMAGHRADVDVAGVIFNRVGGPRHRRLIAAAMAATCPEIPVLGYVPRDEELALPSRHLGLVQAGEHPELDRFLDRAAAVVADAVDPDAVRAAARPGRERTDAAATPVPPIGRIIAVARDDAFGFAYPAVLEGWSAAGATLRFFSPLADAGPAADCDAVFLPGGYPELHAARLAGNRGFLDSLGAAARRGAFVYGECGGYMVLGESLIDAQGRRHAMAGLLPLQTSFATPRLNLGYRQAELTRPSPLGRAGERYRGHAFHYATVDKEGPGRSLFDARDATGAACGETGLLADSVAGSFIHLIDRASV